MPTLILNNSQPAIFNQLDPPFERRNVRRSQFARFKLARYLVFYIRGVVDSPAHLNIENI